MLLNYQRLSITGPSCQRSPRERVKPNSGARPTSPATHWTEQDARAGNAVSQLTQLSPVSDGFQKAKSSALETFSNDTCLWVWDDLFQLLAVSSYAHSDFAAMFQNTFALHGLGGFVIIRWKRHSSISGQMNDPRIAHAGDPNHRAVDLPQDADSSGARIEQTDAIHLWGGNEICLKCSAFGSKPHFVDHLEPKSQISILSRSIWPMITLKVAHLFLFPKIGQQSRFTSPPASVRRQCSRPCSPLRDTAAAGSPGSSRNRAGSAPRDPRPSGHRDRGHQRCSANESHLTPEIWWYHNFWHRDEWSSDCYCHDDYYCCWVLCY